MSAKSEDVDRDIGGGLEEECSVRRGRKMEKRTNDIVGGAVRVHLRLVHFRF